MDPLVSADWLASRFGSPNFRIFETAAMYDDVTGELISARSQYERAHIAGAGYLDLSADLSDHSTDVVLTHPDPQALAETLGAAGIGDDSEVVLYSSDHAMWATRVWWMLHALGFDRKAVLDGGLRAWSEAGGRIEQGSTTYPPTRFTARPRNDCWVDKSGVMAAIDSPGTTVVCALRAETYAGTGPEHYGRRGHISGSLNVPHRNVVDPDTGKFRPITAIELAFRKKGVLDSDRVITYCGGGLAATVDAFGLHLLGFDNVSVYDGSLLEWSKDPSAPMVTGSDP